MSKKMAMGFSLPDRAAEVISPRAVAVEGLARVLFKARPLDSFFDALTADLSRPDRALAKALLWGALRWQGAIVQLKSVLMARPLPRRARRADLILTLALTELLVLRAPSHAAVNEAVTLVKAARDSTPYAGLVNAVLRRAVRDHDQLVNRLADACLASVPDWLQRRWAARHDAATLQALGAALGDIPPLDVTAKSPDRAAALAALDGAIRLSATSVRFTARDPRDLPGFKDGDFWVQDAAAALAVEMMAVAPRQRVLDMGAAPGGKTLQLAARGARVTAIDRSASRMEQVRANLARTGLAADLVVGDALHHKPAAPYDHILLDAPCTALGTYRRNPDILSLRQEADIAAVAAIQRRLLRRAVTLLKPGGTLLYCVCSLEPEEGTAVIRDLLRRTPAMTVIDGKLPDHIQSDGIQLEGGMVTTSPAALRALPPGQRGLDGFFIARLQKSRG